MQGPAVRCGRARAADGGGGHGRRTGSEGQAARPTLTTLRARGDWMGSWGAHTAPGLPPGVSRTRNPL